jgi:DNA-binding CsgD family transcriptional regulator
MLNHEKLLELVADLQLGKLSTDEWLQKLTGIVNCTAAGTAVWPGNNPSHNAIRSSEKFKPLPRNWLAFVEKTIQRSDSKNYDYLDDVVNDLRIEDPFPDSPLQDPRTLIIYLDKSSTRSLMILQRNDSAAAWSSKDRENISSILPGLRKANDLHKLLCLTNNRLDMASKVLDGAPRGIAVLTPDGHVLKANMLGLEVLADNDCFTEVDGKLNIMNKEVQAEFKKQLGLIKDIKLEYLQNFVWNRSFTAPANNRKLQIVVRAYPLDNPYLESNSYDRFVGLFIHTPERYIRPSAKGLQEFYGLTAAQARLVASLLKGNSIKEAADAQKIQLNTARSHMQSIYAIMGVNGQADLMRLIGATLINYEPPPK